MSGHDGHRARLRRRFLQQGLDGFDDHTLLELLLFYAIPRRDTNLIAHRLMDTFRTIDRVFEARPEELMKVEGVGESAAALMHLIPAVSRRYLTAREAVGDVLPDVETTGRYLIPRFIGRTEEIVLLLCLDTKLRVLDCRQVGGGGLTSASFSIREIVQTALDCNASSAVLAHNHPGGIAIPSQEDRSATLLIRDALALVDITLLDHIVVAGRDFVSLADDGLL